MTGTYATGWAVGDILHASEYGKGIGSISDTTLGSPAASVDITSIVQTYEHLAVVIYARSATALSVSALTVQFNGDTGAHYDSQSLYGQAAAPTASESFANSVDLLGYMPAASAGANLFGACVVFIPNYANSTNNKQYVAISSMKSGTSTTNMRAAACGGGWRSNAAITRITIVDGSAGNLVAGTRVTLFGIGA